MADNQQFCLRWHNYKANLTQVFDQLLQSESFVDVTLACEGQSIKAHRIVLSACSPYFQLLLSEADCSHPVIILQGVKWPELKAVVEFMYKGEINVAEHNLAGLLRVAESLKIRGLADVGEGDAAEAVFVSPSSSPRESAWSDDEARRKKRRLSGDEVSGSLSPVLTPNSSYIDEMMGLDLPLGLGRGLPPPAGGMPLAPVSLGSSSVAAASLASSLSTLAAHLPGAMPPPPGPPSVPPHLSHLPPLSPLLNMHHIPRHHAAAPDDFEIRPGIAEMIREEERAKLFESSHHWIGSSMSDSYQAQVQAAWQKSWNQTQSLLQNLRFRERGPLKSWRPETMAEAIHAVLKEGLSLSQAARKYDIPYPTFVLYANRVHNLLGPSHEPGDLRPKGRGRPQRILLGSWPEEQIKGVIRAVVFRDTSVFRDEHKNKHPATPKAPKDDSSTKSQTPNGTYTPSSSSAPSTPVSTPDLIRGSTSLNTPPTPKAGSSSQLMMGNMLPLPMATPPIPGIGFPPLPVLTPPGSSTLTPTPTSQTSTLSNTFVPKLSPPLGASKEDVPPEPHTLKAEVKTEPKDLSEHPTPLSDHQDCQSQETVLRTDTASSSSVALPESSPKETQSPKLAPANGGTPGPQSPQDSMHHVLSPAVEQKPAPQPQQLPHQKNEESPLTKQNSPGIPKVPHHSQPMDIAAAPLIRPQKMNCSTQPMLPHPKQQQQPLLPPHHQKQQQPLLPPQHQKQQPLLSPQHQKQQVPPPQHNTPIPPVPQRNHNFHSHQRQLQRQQMQQHQHLLNMMAGSGLPSNMATTLASPAHIGHLFPEASTLMNNFPSKHGSSFPTFRGPSPTMQSMNAMGAGFTPRLPTTPENEACHKAMLFNKLNSSMVERPSLFIPGVNDITPPPQRSNGVQSSFNGPSSVRPPERSSLPYHDRLDSIKSEPEPITN